MTLISVEVIFSLRLYQGAAKVAAPESLFQPEEHGAGRAEDEGLPGVFRKVGCCAVKAKAAI